MSFLIIAISLGLTAFAQPAWISGFGILAGAFGYALFWKGMLFFKSSRDRFLLAMVWFACVQGVQLSWMTTLDYMGPLILVLWLFLILSMGVQFGLLSLFIKEPLKPSKILFMASLWVVFEWLRLFFLCGFTWNQVGIALTDSPYSLQFASVGGILGLSFWVIIVNLAALKAFLEKSRKQTLIWGGLALFPYFFGFIQQFSIESMIPISKKLDVALVQTGLYPEQKDFLIDDPGAYIAPITQWRRVLEVLDESKKVDLIVLPEAALPLGAHVAGYSLETAKKLFDEKFFPPLKRPFAVFSNGQWKVSNAFLVQTLANQFGAEVIIGLDDHDLIGKYNAAFHFVPKKNNYTRYEKQVLVPVGEYVPARNYRKFSQFVAKNFGIHSSFDAGSTSKIFDSHVPIGISICLEETFSHLIRDFRRKGAQLFVNVTNDVWFPRSKLPEQHFHHGRVRAAENGVALLRSCNTGVTGAVDCFGRTIKLLPKSEEKAGALYLNLPIRSYKTLYTFWGDAGILSVSFVSLAFYLILRKKKLP